MDKRPELAAINRLTLKESLKCLDLKLWDEDKKQLVSACWSNNIVDDLPKELDFFVRFYKIRYSLILHTNIVE